MNLPRRTKRMTTAISAVGTGFTTANVASPVAAAKILEVRVSKQSGTGVTAQVQVREGAAGRLVYDSGSLEAMPVTKNELARQYRLTGGSPDLELAVKVDAGSDTNVSVDVVVEY